VLTTIIKVPDSYRIVPDFLSKIEAYLEANAPCPACNGTGWTAIDTETACPFCNGVAWKNWIEE